MLRFECHYCYATFINLKGLIQHFEAMHRNGEYIVIEAEGLKNDNGY